MELNVSANDIIKVKPGTYNETIGETKGRWKIKIMKVEKNEREVHK